MTTEEETAMTTNASTPEGMWKTGDRVVRFDGTTGTVERIETDSLSIGQNVHVRWDDPNATDEFDGIRDDDLISETDYLHIDFDSVSGTDV